MEAAQAKIAAVMAVIKERDPEQTLFQQACREILESLSPLLAKRPSMADHSLLLRFVEPERIIQFNVTWERDNGEVCVNRAWRVQMNSAIGPFKGGLRFHPSVRLDTLKFLAAEQCLKNSLTGLPMGGGKGGSDFDPKGKSDNEVRRFCNSFTTELVKHIGCSRDIPAGDIGVGARELGYIYGCQKRVLNEAGSNGILTGKDISFGGSLLRTEATGYGAVYFTREMLKTKGKTLAGMTVVISGSGNVAQHACEKATELGAKVVSLSDSSGVIHVPGGIDKEMLAFIKNLKEVKRGRISEVVDKYGADKVKYTPTAKGELSSVWSIPCDVAMPCATQNELPESGAQALIKNGVIAVTEGANMPTTPEAMSSLQAAGVPFAPGKASNAAGVACSGLEMSQNAQRLSWTAEEVDRRLDEIMVNIHASCVSMSKELLGDDVPVNYVLGANCAGFVKIARAMQMQGY